jgi:hypothetical protein
MYSPMYHKVSLGRVLHRVATACPQMKVLITRIVAESGSKQRSGPSPATIHKYRNNSALWMRDFAIRRAFSRYVA